MQYGSLPIWDGMDYLFRRFCAIPNRAQLTGTTRNSRERLHLHAKAGMLKLKSIHKFNTSEQRYVSGD
jgi:hypothetical protein